MCRNTVESYQHHQLTKESKDIANNISKNQSASEKTGFFRKGKAV